LSAFRKAENCLKLAEADQEPSEFSLSVPDFYEVADDTCGDDFSISLSSIRMSPTKSP